jgi:tetratricopeptide (TPR) repeat protein
MIQPLAEFLITNGNYQLQSGLLKEADKAFEEAIEILESLLNTGDISDSRKGGTIIIVGLPPARQIKGELARALQNQSQVRLLQGDNNLAGLLYKTNRLAEAEPLYRRALQIDEQSYGPNHPDVAISLNSLAALLQATNRLAEAEPLIRRALEILTTSLGGSHPNTQTVADNYARLLRAMGKPEAEISKVLSELGSNLAGAGGQAANSPSAKLLAVIEEIMRDQSKLQEIAARLQREDPALFQELVQFIQSQQK